MPVPCTRPDHSAPLPRLPRIPRLAKLSSTRESYGRRGEAGFASPRHPRNARNHRRRRQSESGSPFSGGLGASIPSAVRICSTWSAVGRYPFRPPHIIPVESPPTIRTRGHTHCAQPTLHSSPVRFALPAVSPRCKLRLVRSLEVSPPDPPAFTGKTPPSSQGIPQPIEVVGLLRGTGNPR